MASLAKIIFDAPTHTYRVAGEHWPGVNEAMKAGGLSPDISKFVNWSLLDGKRELGQNVHKMCEEIDWTGRTRPEFADLVGYEKAYRTFLELERPTWRIVEKCLAHRRYRYCGTPDRVGFIPKFGETVVDIKSGQIHDHFGPALAAYGMLARCRKGYKRIVLKLHANGTYDIHEFNNPNDEDAFKAAVKIYWWKKDKKGLKVAA